MEIQPLKSLTRMQLRFLLVAFWLGREAYWARETVTRVSAMTDQEIISYLSGKSAEHVVKMFKKGAADLQRIQRLRPHLEPVFFAALNKKIPANSNRKAA